MILDSDSGESDLDIGEEDEWTPSSHFHNEVNDLNLDADDLREIQSDSSEEACDIEMNMPNDNVAAFPLWFKNKIKW